MYRKCNYSGLDCLSDVELQCIVGYNGSHGLELNGWLGVAIK